MYLRDEQLEKLKFILKINDINDINEVNRKYKEYAKKYHPDINKLYDEELYKEITEIYNIYKKLHKFIQNSNNIKKNNNIKKEETANFNTFRKKEGKKSNKKKEINININIIDLLLKETFNFFINNKQISIKNDEIKLNKLTNKIIKDDIVINYKIILKNNIKIDFKTKRIIYNISLPFQCFIFKTNLKIHIANYIINLSLNELNPNILIELNTEKFKRNLYLKLTPIFPQKENLTNFEKKILLNLKN